VANNIEVIFRQLSDELATVKMRSQNWETMRTSDPESTTKALREFLTYGGFVAQHLKEAYRYLKEVEIKPTSVSAQIGGMVITWDLA